LTISRILFFHLEGSNHFRKYKVKFEKSEERPVNFRFEGSPGAADTRPVAATPDAALAAKGRDRFADILAESHQKIIDGQPITPGKFLPQSHFRLFRRFRLNVSPTVGDPVNMGVNADARFAESQGDDQICGFTAHTGQFHQFVQVVGYPAVVKGQENSTNLFDVFGLGLIESHRVYTLFDARNSQACHRMRLSGQLKQPLAGGIGRLVLRPQGQQARYEHGERRCRVMADCRQAPFLNRLSQDSKNGMNLSIAHNSESIDPDPQNRGPDILKPVCFASQILGENNNPIDCRRVKVYPEQLIRTGNVL
jgi:hypothetical protein